MRGISPVNLSRAKHTASGWAHWKNTIYSTRCFSTSRPPKRRTWTPSSGLFPAELLAQHRKCGYDARSLSGSRCGVFVGCAGGDYHHLSRHHELSAQGFTGSSMSILAARISYFLNLQGLRLHRYGLLFIPGRHRHACDSLISGASDVALAAGSM